MRRSETSTLRRNARILAALGDETRLALVSRLSAGTPLTISALTAGTRVTRQSITKHLRVLEEAGLVRGVRQGRQSFFELQPRPLGEARQALESIASQWEQALGRLRAFVEQNPDV